MRPALRRRAWRWTVLTVAILAVYLFPVYWMVQTSFQPDATSAGVAWFPPDPSLDAYAQALGSGGLRGLRVSIIVALGTVAVTLVIATPAAYALSRMRSRAVTVGLVLLLLAQMIPSVVLTLSFYAMYSAWGVLNSYIGLILAHATLGIPFAVILMRSFMQRMDHEVVEAATVDGLGPLGSLLRIVVPLSRNAIITAAVFTFLFSWGDLLFGLTLVTRADMYPVTAFILGMTADPLNRWAPVMAISLVASLPALVVIFSAQRFVKAGLTSGSAR